MHEQSQWRWQRRRGLPKRERDKLRRLRRWRWRLGRLKQRHRLLEVQHEPAELLLVGVQGDHLLHQRHCL